MNLFVDLHISLILASLLFRCSFDKLENFEISKCLHRQSYLLIQHTQLPSYFLFLKKKIKTF